jgi:hypothetical protein
VPRAISRLPQAPGAGRPRVTAQEAAGFEACGRPGQLLVRVAVRGGRLREWPLVRCGQRAATARLAATAPGGADLPGAAPVWPPRCAGSRAARGPRGGQTAGGGVAGAGREAGPRKR